MKKQLLVMFSLVVPGILLSPMALDAFAGPEIVGAPKCTACHKAKTGDQWQIWTGSAHARAFETLASAAAGQIAADKGLGDPRQEAYCLQCHTTRGYLGAASVIAANGKYTDEEGVGCEACHGPGSEYKSMKTMKDPAAARAAGLVMAKTAAACTRCHNEESPTYKAFDFDRRWAEIAHPAPVQDEARAALAEALANMPDEITFASAVGDVHFPHKVHVRDFGIGCVDCHHQIHATELDTPHQGYLDSSWIKCQVCHNTNSAASGKYYKCSDCHQSDTDDIADETLSAKVVTHQSCWKCHDSGTGVEASEGCGDCHVKAGK